MCNVSTHNRPLSFSLRVQFMAGISMFTRKGKKGQVFSILLSKNGCCNAALRFRWRRDGVTGPSRWDSWLTAWTHGGCFSFKTLVYLQYYVSAPSTNGVRWHRKRAVCWVTAVTYEHQSEGVKHTPTFRPPAPAHTEPGPWIYEYHMNILIPTRWTQRQSQG